MPFTKKILFSLVLAGMLVSMLACENNIKTTKLAKDKYLLNATYYQLSGEPNFEQYGLDNKIIKLCPIGNKFIYQTINSRADIDQETCHNTKCKFEVNILIECTDKPRLEKSIFGKFN